MSVLLSKIDGNNYELYCTICKKPAYVIGNGIPSYLNELCVIFKGITHIKAVDIKYAPKIYRFLDKNDITGLHMFLIKKHLLDFGLDAYCPQCDACYCAEHYQINPVIDEEGFYDYSMACCPYTHERMIDD